MRKFIFAIPCYLLVLALQAQVPQAFSFQGVAFDANGKPVADKNITVKAEILKGAPDGNVEYSELHNTITNANGLYSLSIGYGNIDMGTFENIDWTSGQKYLSISLDPNGGHNFAAMGITQLLSVPYALVSGNALVTKPKVMVAKNPKFSQINVNAEELNAGSLKIYQLGYVYRWIDGTPETVFVDYINLPNELALFNEGGETSNYTGIVESKTDTIDLGLYQRTTYITLDNKDFPIAHGDYDVTLVFRTEAEILDSVAVRFHFGVNSIQICRDNLIGIKNLSKVNCYEIDSSGNVIMPVTDAYFENLIGTSMELKTSPTNNQLVTLNFLDNKNGLITLSDCTSGTFFPGNFTANAKTINIDRIQIESGDKVKYHLDVKSQSSNENYKCEVTYE